MPVIGFEVGDFGFAVDLTQWGVAANIIAGYAEGKGALIDPSLDYGLLFGPSVLSLFPIPITGFYNFISRSAHPGNEHYTNSVGYAGANAILMACARESGKIFSRYF